MCGKARSLNPSEICGSFVEQMFGTPAPQAGEKPNRWGFLHNYKTHTQPRDPSGTMECYTLDQVPVLSQLAKSYAVCDRWFGSAACETWPNRSFVWAPQQLQSARHRRLHPKLRRVCRNALVFDVHDELALTKQTARPAVVSRRTCQAVLPH
jgi:hypothetical protein